MLPLAIQADADTVLANMDNPDTWALVNEQRADLFKVVTIGHRCVGFALGIMFICSRQPQLLWMSQQGELSCECVKFLAQECYCWRDVMASCGRITPGTVCHVTCHILMGRYTLVYLIFLLA
jgi:hypothetical protein